MDSSSPGPAHSAAWTGGIAAAGSIVVAAGLLIALPSDGASLSLDYSCSIDLLGSTSLTSVQDTDAPDAAFAGQQISTTLTSVLVLPVATQNVFHALGAETIQGTANETLRAGGATVTSHLALPKTPLFGGPAINAHGPLSFNGTDLAHSLVLDAGRFTLHLTFKDAAGNVVFGGPLDGFCTLDASQNATVDTVALSHDETRSTLTAPDVGKGKMATVKVRVKGLHGGAATGMVTAKLFRSGTVVRKDSARLHSGKAVLSFRRIARAGRYQVRSIYEGNKSFGTSRAKATFRVG